MRSTADHREASSPGFIFPRRGLRRRNDLHNALNLHGDAFAEDLMTFARCTARAVQPVPAILWTPFLTISKHVHANCRRRTMIFGVQSVCHPHHSKGLSRYHSRRSRHGLQRRDVVAIGETELDFHKATAAEC